MHSDQFPASYDSVCKIKTQLNNYTNRGKDYKSSRTLRLGSALGALVTHRAHGRVGD